MAKVSVIIPTYNQPMLLCEAIDSVLNQTFNDLELIIVDDGSTDNTSDIIARYKKRSNKIRYFFQKNGGPSAARNAGIQLSNGEYVSFLDHDDILLPTKIEKQVDFLSTNKNFGMVFSNAYEFNREGVTKKYRLKNIDRRQMSGYILKYLIMRCFILSPSVMIRRTVLDDIGYFDTRFLFSQDWDYWLRVARKYEIGFLDEVLVGYRRHAGNITNNLELHIKERHKVIDFAFDKKIIPDAISKYVRLSHAFICYEYGEECLVRGNRTKARSEFVKSLIYNPFNIKTYIVLIKAFIPSFILKYLRRVKYLLLKKYI